MLEQLCDNVLHNLFKPILLFFYAGFLIPILRVKFEFPKVIYQGLTIYLLLAIGWHGGEELAELHADSVGQAIGFMILGFVTNLLIGVIAFALLRCCTRLRKVDAATVAGYYGSDSAGTFVTCLGVLHAANLMFAPYMPVMLAVMEIPGCLVALLLVDKMRRSGMDSAGNMPGEAGYLSPAAARVIAAEMAMPQPAKQRLVEPEVDEDASEEELELELVGVGAGEFEAAEHAGSSSTITRRGGHGSHARRESNDDFSERSDWDEMELDELEAELAAELARDRELQKMHAAKAADVSSSTGSVMAQPNRSPKMAETLHEVFFNPGIFLLFAGITIGFVSRWQGTAVTASGDKLFNELFQGALCLFLLEMGMTASQRLRDLKTAGWGFIAFGVLAPNLFAMIGISAAHAYSLMIGQPFDVGTYVVFAVLCGAASYIAVPAVQRLAIPEASPTLPLAAALGLTFTYNVTIGIPVYIMVATQIISYWPVGQ